MQQSVTLAFAANFFSFTLPADADAVGDSGTPPSARSCFMASLLSMREIVSANAEDLRTGNALEVVLATLSLTSNLDLHLDTTIHLFCSALVIDTELNDIAVLCVRSSVVRQAEIPQDIP